MLCLCCCCQGHPALLTVQLRLFFLISLWNCSLLELETQSLADLGKSKLAILGFRGGVVLAVDSVRFSIPATDNEDKLTSSLPVQMPLVSFLPSFLLSLTSHCSYLG